MKTRLNLFAIIISTLVLVGITFGQDDRKSNSFDSMIDSIVEDSFTRFDEKYNTYIFTDEPREYGEEDDDLEDWSNDSRFLRRKRISNSRLYAGTNDSRLNQAAYISYPWELNNEHFFLRYNRVEALFLGLNYPNSYTWDERSASLFGSVGYGFASHRWRYSGGVSQQFGMGTTLIELGVEGHSLTDTKDQWIIDETENSLASFFVRDDYRDYFGREGVSGWFGLFGKWKSSDMQFRAAYLNDQYQSLDWKTNWSVFGGDKLFRDNPPVWEGRMRSVLASFEIHQEKQRTYFTSGWKAALSAEVAGTSFGGDFEFNKYVIDFIRYQPLSKYENLNFRLRAGSTTGDVPPQKWFELGGISTLPAFSYKEFPGNRIALFNAEYMLNGKIFDAVDVFPSWLLRNCNLMLFYDAGYANAVAGNEKFDKGFENLSASTIKSDWGIGIGSRDAKLRLGFAWRTDVAEPVHAFLRLNRPF
ncbi:MAG: BamA/TamA family outer membrane protein [Ignavibacteriales bacterium]|nr:BamA/TamA family outer membrane protein [Ignavibacteriales bacterium]